MPGEEALEERQQKRRQNENDCAIERSVPRKGLRERAAQGEDEDDERQSRSHPVESLGGAETWRISLHVDDVERSENGEKSKDTPNQPKRIAGLVLEDAVDGKPCSDNVSGNVFDQFLKVRVCVLGVGWQILFNKENSEGIPHGGSPGLRLAASSQYFVSSKRAQQIQHNHSAQHQTNQRRHSSCEC